MGPYRAGSVETSLGWTMRLLRDLPWSREGSEEWPDWSRDPQHGEAFQRGGHESHHRIGHLGLSWAISTAKDSCCGGWGDEAGRAEAEESAGRCHFISHNLAKPVQGHSCYSKFIKGILDTSLFLWFCVLLCFILFLSKVPFENYQICLRFMPYYLSWVILLLVIDSRDQLDQGTWRLEVVVGGNNNTTSCCMTCSIFLSHLALIIVWNKHYCSCVRKEKTNLRFREIQSPINVK